MRPRTPFVDRAPWTAFRGLAGAVQVPERHFEDVAARMAEDAAALRRIAGAAENMRRPIGT